MTIEERLEALEKETQKLRDVIEIMNLKGKYFRCLDSKDWDGLETTFSPQRFHFLLQWQAFFPRPQGGHQLLQADHAR